MVTLIRNGSRMLFVETSRRSELVAYLTDRLKAERYDVDIVFDKSDEFNTVLYLLEDLKPQVKRQDITETLLVRSDMAQVLCRLIQEADPGWISAIRPAPQTLLMRAVGDMEQMLQKIQGDFGGEIGSYTACMEGSRETSTILGLTDKPLSRSAKLSDLHPNLLRLEQDYAALRRELSMHAFKYLNKSLDHQEWNEFEIRIYDIYGAYKLHYERLLEVLDALELGIVIGEAWSKDYPRVMMPVEVYSVHFLTFLAPVAFKRLLLGLEHLPDGRRIVDLDLYVEKKKIYWKDTVSSERKKNRFDEAHRARNELMERLENSTQAELARMESEILATRA